MRWDGMGWDSFIDYWGFVRQQEKVHLGRNTMAREEEGWREGQLKAHRLKLAKLTTTGTCEHTSQADS